MMQGFTAETPLWKAAREIMGTKVREFGERLRTARTTFGHTDVHDLRVASRRLREAVAMLDRCYPADRLAWIRRRARRVTRCLGTLRNADELVLFVASRRRDFDGPARAELRQFISGLAENRAYHVRTADRVLAALDSSRAVRHMSSLADRPYLICAPTDAADPFSPIGVVAPGLIAAYPDALCRLAAPALVESGADAQHRLRIAVKHFRYRTEMLAPLIGSGASILIRRLKKYQTLLGDMHDIDVFSALLAALPFSRTVRDRVSAVLSSRRSAMFSRFSSLHTRAPLAETAAEVRRSLEI